MIQKVVKRDGTIEVYDKDKIKKVVMAAGLEEDKADKLVALVNDWAKKIKTKTVKSLQIRDRILVEIQKLDEYAAKQFIWYEKYKDRTFGIKK